ncbi:MAG: class I SAM-dependent methyltransferase [Patescibacteria group bacterium]|nr:class I SAM-dependent methyltransferase [Patescibacteria group bacterium]
MPKKGKDFWNKEYAKGKRRGGPQEPHLALSTEPAEDLIKFTNWLERNYGRKFLNVTTLALDCGCGNGRNLIYLAKEFGMRGYGYDISSEAITQAKRHAANVPSPEIAQRVQYEVRTLAEPIPLPEMSVTLALDMMSSHVLRRTEREAFRAELLRVLKPGGWLFFKSFLLEEDTHAKRLLKEYPGPEEGMYIHPEIGKAEYVWTESTLREFFEPYFTIHKIEKSHKHRHADGTAWKRRTISAYMEKA